MTEEAPGKNKRAATAKPLDSLQFGWRRRLPVILQTEASECGLACLAMIASYHGHDVDLPGLRRHFSMSLKGASLSQIMSIAGELELQPRPLRLELDDLRHLKVPCLLHWDLNHFVVLKRVGKRFVEIHDPARGAFRLTYKEVSDHFTGIALELSPAASFKPIKARQAVSLRALTGKTRGLTGALTQILLLALTLEVFTLVGPFYLQWVLDQVLTSADKNLLTMLGIGFLLLAVLKTLISAARAWTIAWLGAMLNVQWVANVFTHLLKLPLDWYEKRHVGDVVSRFSSMHTIQQTLTTDFVAALLDGVMASLTLVVLALYSIKLTLIVLTAFGLYACLRWFAYKPLRRAQEDLIVYQARQQSNLLEAIRGAQTLKLHNQQQPRSTQYANAVVETANRNIAMQRLNITFQSGDTLIFGIEKTILIWLAALLVLDGTFTAGMLVAFAAYADQFVTRATSLVDKGIQFRMLGLHSERVADIALSDPEQHVESKWDAPLPDAEIKLCNVSFRYAESEPWILKSCSLTIPAGETAALIGPSGCGKTTLAKIILGLLEPQEGEVLYGGIDIRRLGLGRYRDQVGAVMQDDQLFAGSIADNIACFDPESNPALIEQAARLAAIHDDIVAMPVGYQTLVGDMGSALSGGQKQRLLVARALYRRPTLLVLDEATSHLDIERERQVNAAIKSMQITRIVIAHRRESVLDANQLFVVDAGTVQQKHSWNEQMQARNGVDG